MFKRRSIGRYRSSDGLPSLLVVVNLLDQAVSAPHRIACCSRDVNEEDSAYGGSLMGFVDYSSRGEDLHESVVI